MAMKIKLTELFQSSLLRKISTTLRKFFAMQVLRNLKFTHHSQFTVWMVQWVSGQQSYHGSF